MDVEPASEEEWEAFRAAIGGETLAISVATSGTEPAFFTGNCFVQPFHTIARVSHQSFAFFASPAHIVRHEILVFTDTSGCVDRTMLVRGGKVDLRHAS